MGGLASQPFNDAVFRPGNILVLLVVLYGVDVGRNMLALRRKLATFGDLPGSTYLYGPFSIIGRLLPPLPYINRGVGWLHKGNYSVHEKYNSDVITNSTIQSRIFAVLLIADANVTREITSKRTEFPKPVRVYKSISMFGPNIVASEFDEWKRHRKIAAPSFSEKNNRLVYEETTRITEELFQYWEAQNEQPDTVVIDSALDITSKLALMVIAAAAFGSRYGWNDANIPPTGHRMTFQQSLYLVMNNVFPRMLLKDSILRLWKGGRDIIVAFEELRVWMNEMVEDRRRILEGGETGEADLFTSLIEGTDLDSSEKAGDKLSRDDLLGNTFIFLFAGHETTAHSLGFTLALLATHPEEQERAFMELRALVPIGETPTYAQIVRWTYGLCITYESLRMFPPVTSFPKQAANDCVLTTTSADGKNTRIDIPVPAGTDIVINIPGLHYNPKYWDEPREFKPERFLGDYNRDAFMPFSGGARSCIGRRFSEIEALTFLANVVLTYTIAAAPPKDGTTETPAETKERLLRWKQGSITLYPENVPLVLRKRK